MRSAVEGLNSGLKTTNYDDSQFERHSSQWAINISALSAQPVTGCWHWSTRLAVMLLLLFEVQGQASLLERACSRKCGCFSQYVC
jgi:steroid 5-alpha reductase family enzyme